MRTMATLFAQQASWLLHTNCGGGYNLTTALSSLPLVMGISFYFQLGDSSGICLVYPLCMCRLYLVFGGGGGLGSERYNLIFKI